MLGVLKNAAIAGASGLVGGECLKQLLGSPAIGKVLSLGRRKLTIEAVKLEQRVVDFAALGQPAERVDLALCALGTTKAIARTAEAFRRVDLDYVREFARWAHEAGAGAFVLISSVGAKANAGNLYLQTKGEAESAVAALGFGAIAILRPSFLLGERSIARPGEVVGIALATLLGPLLAGSLTKYRPIAAAAVARAAVRVGLMAPAGYRVLHYGEISAEGRAS